MWEEEKKIAAMVLMNNEMGLAWAETEKRRFCEDYFLPVVFPVIKHIPWCKKSLPIPPGI